jgi:hypothetical protein
VRAHGLFLGPFFFWALNIHIPPAIGLRKTYIIV